MNVLKRLTLKDLKLNKKRTIGTIIGVSLSCALIVVVGLFFFIMRATLINSYIEADGYYHLKLGNVFEEQIDEIKRNRDFSHFEVVDYLGNFLSLNDEISFDVYSYSKDSLDYLKISVREGELPKNKNEVIVPYGYISLYNLKIGDTCEFSIDNTLYKMTIVGYSNSYDTFITTGIESSVHDIYITLDNPNNHFKVINNLLGVANYKKPFDTCNFESYSVNSNLIMWETLDFGNSTRIIGSLFAVVIFIIMLVSIFAIRNSFAISISEKVRLYGMLSSVGATRKQIRKMVLFEGFIVGCIGIFIGCFLGVFATFITTVVVNKIAYSAHIFNYGNGLVFVFSFLPIIVSVILSFVVIYFSVIVSAIKASRTSPIQNIRNSSNLKNKKLKVPFFVNSIFGIGGVLSYKNLKRSKKKYRVTVISLVISIMVFITASSVVEYGLNIIKNEYSTLNYNLVIYSNGDDILEDYVDEFKKLDNPIFLYYTHLDNYEFMYDSKVNDDAVLFLDDIKFVNYVMYAYDDISYRRIVEDLNFDYNYVKDKYIILNNVKYRDGDKIKYDGITDYKKGDIITFKSYESNDYINIVVGGVTDSKTVGFEGDYNRIVTIIGDYDYMKENLNAKFFLNNVYFDSDDPYELERDLYKSSKNFYIENYEDLSNQMNSIIIIASIFAYGFIIVLTLIGVTSVFNTINSNMELRKSEFATLKSIGMTKKEFNRMINLESFFYSFKSLVYGIILGIIGSVFSTKLFFSSYELEYQFPINSIIISILFVFILVLAIMRYSIKKIDKQNIIETIRSNNV